MSADPGNRPPEVAPEAAPAPRRRGWLLPLTLLGLGFLGAVAAWWWFPRPQPPAFGPGAGNAVQANALDDYLPEDAAALVVVNARELREAPVYAGRLEKDLRPAIACGFPPFDARCMALLGLDPNADVDELRLVTCAGDPSRPLLLLRGRVRPERFEVGPGHLRELDTATPAGRLRLYAYTDQPSGRTGYLAAAGDFLIFSEAKGHVVAALEQAARPRALRLQDEALAAAVREADRSATLWLAVSFRKLGPVPTLTEGAAENLLRPFFDNATVVRASLRAGSELEGRMELQGGGDGHAAALEEATRTVIDLAAGVRDFAPERVPKAYRPLTELLAAARWQRQGRSVILTARWSP